jgi:hypothetical protein
MERKVTFQSQPDILGPEAADIREDKIYKDICAAYANFFFFPICTSELIYLLRPRPIPKSRVNLKGRAPLLTNHL